jgi:hypothetical protein
VKTEKFKITAAQRKVRVAWDRIPVQKVKESKKKYNRKRDKKWKRED